MIDFSALQGLFIPEGVVTQITDASGKVLWMANTDTIILEVQKMTHNTYANETLYENEQFILLDIYPKTNGTVKVTYGGLTKTITDTSGAEEPNAQQVFFGTFNGVSDSVATPTRGRLTIEGDYYKFGNAEFKQSSTKLELGYKYTGIVGIYSFGSLSTVPESISGFMLATSLEMALETINITHGVTTIAQMAFVGFPNLKSVKISDSVTTITGNPFWGVQIQSIGDIVTIDSRNPTFKIECNCLFDNTTKKVISGFADSSIPVGTTIIGNSAFYFQEDLPNITIPDTVTTIETSAFAGCSNFTDITIPSSVTTIGTGAFNTIQCRVTMLSTTPPTLSGSIFVITDDNGVSYLKNITVPKGCGAAYKAAEYWNEYADYIVEAS